MDIGSIAKVMYPYWIMGAFVIWATIQGGYRNTVRIEKKAVFTWLKFLVCLTIYRLLLFKLFPGHFSGAAKNVSQIPLLLTFTTPWEDACHGLPLLLLRNFIGTDKWYKWLIHIPALAIVMVSFGLGHVYQGVGAAAMLSLYIPYSIYMGKKYGFGTVMVGHVAYDFMTLLTMKLTFGF